MNIVFLAHFAGSPKYGMVLGHYYLAREWVKAGHSVTIYAASFAHTRFKQPEVVAGKFCQEYIDGIRYVWVPCPEYNAGKRLGRVLNILTFATRLMRCRHLVDRPDIVISSSHHPFAIFPARKMAKKWNALLVFEVRDLWPLTLIELGGVSARHPFIRLMQWAEDFAYRHADHVVSVLADSKEYMVQRGMEERKFSYISNGADVTVLQKHEPLPDRYLEIIRNARQRGDFLIGYAGRMGEANALGRLLEAVADIRKIKISVFLLGDGYCKKSLQQLAIRNGLGKQVFFLDPVETSQVADFLSEMDVLYIGLLPKPIFRFGVSPTKLNDYLLAAKPVVYAVDAPNEAITKSGAGVICPSNTKEEISKAVIALADMPVEQRQVMGERGRAWLCQNLDYAILAKRFLAEVNDGRFSPLSDKEL